MGLARPNVNANSGGMLGPIGPIDGKTILINSIDVVNEVYHGYNGGKFPVCQVPLGPAH